MIRLTDKEIERAVDRGTHSATSDEAEEIAKAQLKKVVEWLTDNDLLKHSHLHYDSTYAGMVEGCEACALLEEVKE